MELPIVSKYDEKFVSLHNQNWDDQIRILDIDGTYLISIWYLEKETKKFLNYQEIAFDSLWEAEEYLIYDLGIEIPEKEPEEEYIIYDDPE